jgi:hypothetical protein
VLQSSETEFSLYRAMGCHVVVPYEMFSAPPARLK